MHADGLVVFVVRPERFIHDENPPADQMTYRPSSAYIYIIGRDHDKSPGEEEYTRA